MSALFAFNVSKPIKPSVIEELGSHYDQDTQMWVGRERALAVRCTNGVCGYSGYQRCKLETSTFCIESDIVSTHPYYSCIYTQCDV